MLTIPVIAPDGPPRNAAGGGLLPRAKAPDWERLWAQNQSTQTPIPVSCYLLMLRVDPNDHPESEN